MNRVAIGVTTLLFVGVLLFALFPGKRKMSNHPTIQQISRNFAMIRPEYVSIPIVEGDSSYTENKEFISLCIKDPDSNKIYDMNTMMYVALHELAHVISRGHGHGDEWRKNFDNLLKIGEMKGFYNSNIPIPSTYCGMHKET